MSTEFRKVAFITLGCKLNFAESSMLKNSMIEKGFQFVQFNDGADVFVINTCSVTENADRECRKIIRRVKRISPNSISAVIGCYAQLNPSVISEIPGVNLVLCAGEKFNLLDHINKLHPNSPVSVFNGVSPLINESEDDSAEVDAVGKWLTELADNGVSPHEFGVFVRSVSEISRACMAVEKIRDGLQGARR